MRLSTLCIAALVAAAALSLTGALAASYDQAAPLAAAGTTPNNLTGAGAMFGNKYQGDVRFGEEEEKSRKNGFRCATTRDGGEGSKEKRSEKKNSTLTSSFFLSLKKNRALTTATTAAPAPAPTSSPALTARRGSTASPTGLP